MWTREDLKNKAKAFLSVNYWQAFLVSLVIGVFSARGGGGGGNSGSRVSEFQDPVVVLIFLSILALVIIVVLLLKIFLGNPLEVGGRRFYIQGANGNVSMSNLGYAFSNNYSNVVRTMFWRGLLNLLFYLLLIIPGIIKSFAYRMVPYILADNPDMEYYRAIELSERMTDNQKLDMFVLDLSFMGWYLLGLLACCIGVIFVLPYYDATYVQLYLTLRQKALNLGFCTYEELRLERPIQ